MSRFRDVYLPECVAGYGAVSSPLWSTIVVQVSSGAEQAIQRWSQPLMSFSLPDVVRDNETMNAVWNHWMVMSGQAHTFPFRDPVDHASVDHPPAVDAVDMISPYDQYIGRGDGVNRVFQLQREYKVGGFTFVREIYRPVVDTVLISVEDEYGDMQPVTSGWSVDRMTGNVTFDEPPASNREIRAGFIYDVEVRFVGDNAMGAVVRTYKASGYSSLELVEVRSC